MTAVSTRHVVITIVSLSLSLSIPILIRRVIHHPSSHPSSSSLATSPDARHRRYIARAFAFAARTMMKTSPRAVDPSRVDAARRRARRRDTPPRTRWAHPGRRHTRGGTRVGSVIDRYRSIAVSIDRGIDRPIHPIGWVLGISWDTGTVPAECPNAPIVWVNSIDQLGRAGTRRCAPVGFLKSGALIYLMTAARDGERLARARDASRGRLEGASWCSIGRSVGLARDDGARVRRRCRRLARARRARGVARGDVRAPRRGRLGRGAANRTR